MVVLKDEGVVMVRRVPVKVSVCIWEVIVVLVAKCLRGGSREATVLGVDDEGRLCTSSNEIFISIQAWYFC